MRQENTVARPVYTLTICVKEFLKKFCIQSRGYTIQSVYLLCTSVIINRDVGMYAPVCLERAIAGGMIAVQCLERCITKKVKTVCMNLKNNIINTRVRITMYSVIRCA